MSDGTARDLLPNAIWSRHTRFHRAHLAAALLVGIAACIFPTDTCACVYPPPVAKVFGLVHDAAGTPVAGASVTVRASRAPCGAESDASPLMTEVKTSEGGMYRAVPMAPTEGSTCVHVRAASAGGASATATAIVRARMDTRESFLDSVRIDLALP